MKAFEHLSDERIQAFLDAELSQAEMAGVQGHAASCPRCQSEIEAWRTLFDELEELPALEPPVSLADAVLGGLPRRVPVGLRMPEWLSPRPRESSTEHLPVERLQEYVDGTLSAQGRGRVETHVADCSSCRDELAGWTTLFARLEDLTELAPSDEFAHRVMERVQIRTPAPVATRPMGQRVRALAAAWVPRDAAGSVRSWAARLVPRSRRAWAVIASLAAAPTVAVVAVAFMVFSHPLLTPGYLTSYLWWKATDLSSAVGDRAMAWSLSALEGLRSNAVVEAVAGSTTGLLLVALSLTALMAVSLWIVYRNLFAPSVDARYVRISS